ncbi:hypothetical protein [Methylobacterium sp. SD21]|uniref:hypothetical protein n=1 Tax=Methylobacterium litchii TaxID=3138810 RepID=UPI00313E73D4
MREFEFRYDIADNPDVDFNRHITGMAYGKCLVENIREPWFYPTYVNSTLPADLGRFYRPSSGMTIHKLDGTELGVLLRIDPVPRERCLLTYRCVRRLTNTAYKRCRDPLNAARPFIVIGEGNIVMRAQATRGRALRDAFITIGGGAPLHDPGALPEGEDLDALAGLG